MRALIVYLYTLLFIIINIISAKIGGARDRRFAVEKDK